MNQNIIRFPNSPTQKSNQSFLQRLRAMTARRYGVGVNHLHQYELSDGINQKLIQMSAVIADGSLYLPIHCLGDYKGALMIRDIYRINIDQRNSLVDFLRTTAVPYFEHLHRKEALAKRQRHLESQITHEKVISFREHLSAKNQEDHPAQTKSWDWKKDTIESRPVPIVIESESSELIARAAMELHQLSPRMIFLHFSDIDEKHRGDARSLYELGDTTIFVKDLTELSQKERQALFTLLAEHPEHEDGPAIYIGCTGQLSDQTSELGLSAEEKRWLPRFQLNLRDVPKGTRIDHQLRSFIQYSSSSFQV